MNKIVRMIVVTMYLVLGGFCYGEGDAIKIKGYDIKILTELPESFLIKTQDKLPPVDAEKLYSNLYSLRNQRILNVTEWELFAETGKKNILDRRTVIPGTDEKEGLYVEVTPEIKKDNKIGCEIKMTVTKLVELRTVTAEEKENKNPIMNVEERIQYIFLTPDKPEIIMGIAGAGGIGMNMGGNLAGVGMTPPAGIPKAFTMLLATRYAKPKASIEFRLVKNTPEAGFTQTAIPDSEEKIYIADKSEINNSDIRGVKSGLSHQGFEQIEIIFTDEGTQKFSALTQRIINERLAILINGDIISMPVVREKIAGGVVTTPMQKEIMEKILGE